MQNEKRNIMLGKKKNNKRKKQNNKLNTFVNS